MSVQRSKVRYAVVGLGYISQIAVLPAFHNARRNSELVAFVSDDPDKMKELSAEYNVELTYGYEDYEECLRSGSIDAVYIALPNHMHHEYSMAAMNAGIHVLCEKPMAVTESECEQMIQLGEQKKVKLMVSYRLHFERANLAAIELARSGEIGEPRFFNSLFSMQVKEDNIRLNDVRLGGGPLYDLGIYCINAARNLFEAEPEEVFAFRASSDDRRFQDCEEVLCGVLRFPGERLATFTTSFNSGDTSEFTLAGTRGVLRMDPSFDYSGDLVQYLTTEGRFRKRTFKKRDQFGPVLLYFSNCVLKDEEPEPSGWEGLADVRIITALHASTEAGKPLPLEPFQKKRRPSMDQEMQKPAVERPDLVHAESPSRK